MFIQPMIFVAGNIYLYTSTSKVDFCVVLLSFVAMNKCMFYNEREIDVE